MHGEWECISTSETELTAICLNPFPTLYFERQIKKTNKMFFILPGDNL